MTNSQTTSEGDKVLAGLLGSETRVRLLKMLILDSKKSFSLTELARQVEMDISGVHREITRLVSLEIVEVDKTGKGAVYKINRDHPLFSGLLELFKKADSLSQKYFLFEEMPVCYPAVACDYMNLKVTNDYLERQGIKLRLSKTLTVYEYPKTNLYFVYDEFNEISKEILSKLIEDPQFGIKDVKDTIKVSDDLFNLADEIENENYAKFSSDQILKALKKYYLGYEATHMKGWIGNGSDMPDMGFTNYLLFILKEKIRKKGSLLKVSDAFSKLTTPREESFMQKEHENLLNLLVEINSGPELREIFKKSEPRHILKEIKGKKIEKKIEKHTRDYGWLGYGFIGPKWDETYFIGIMSSLLRQDKSPEKMIEEIKQDRERLFREQEKIIKSLGLDDNEQKLFEVARGFVFTKGYRKDSMFKFYSRIEMFYKEIARRLHVSVTDIRFCFPHEFEKLMSSDPKLIKTLRERQKFFVWESIGKYEDDIYLTGQEARKHLKKLSFEKEESTDVSILNGACACPGRSKSKVKIINIPKEMSKMEKGDILVSIATSPDLVPAMKKASAIVTDMGGITSHAAIVSRELNIPCV